MRQCEVFVHDRKAGVLTENARNSYEFDYDKEYLKSKDAVPVSLTLPLSDKTYHSEVLFPFFLICFPRVTTVSCSRACSTSTRMTISAYCLPRRSMTLSEL